MAFFFWPFSVLGLLDSMARACGRDLCIDVKEVLSMSRTCLAAGVVGELPEFLAEGVDFVREVPCFLANDRLHQQERVAPSEGGATYTSGALSGPSFASPKALTHTNTNVPHISN